MPIRYIQYQPQRVVNMEVAGYSLYINENFCFSSETIQEVQTTAKRYSAHNDVEIYPLMKKQETTMSKVKEQMMQEQQEEFEFELSYQEWLKDNIKEPSEDELNEMEEDFNKPSAVSNQIITYKPLNNTTYNPIGEQL